MTRDRGADHAGDGADVVLYWLNHRLSDDDDRLAFLEALPDVIDWWKTMRARGQKLQAARSDRAALLLAFQVVEGGKL